VRRTFKFVGDHPIKGLIFDKPIDIEISSEENDHDEPLVIENNTPFVDVPPPTNPSIPLPKPLHYVPYQLNNLHGRQKLFLKKINETFAETLGDDSDKILAMYKIVDVVTTVKNPRTFYYKYYDILNEIPTSDDDFEYSLCTNVLQHGWANFDLGTMVAKSIKKGKALGMPNSFLSAINHAESEAFLVAFKLELESWIRLKGMLPNTGDNRLEEHRSPSNWRSNAHFRQKIQS
jgi:hypothetical protein